MEVTGSLILHVQLRFFTSFTNKANLIPTEKPTEKRTRSTYQFTKMIGPSEWNFTVFWRHYRPPNVQTFSIIDRSWPTLVQRHVRWCMANHGQRIFMKLPTETDKTVFIKLTVNFHSSFSAGHEKMTHTNYNIQNGYKWWLITGVILAGGKIKDKNNGSLWWQRDPKIPISWTWTFWASLNDL